MQQKIGFTKGMRRSLSPENYGEESYFEAVNKQIVFDEKSLTASITDEQGTTAIVMTSLLSEGDTISKIFSVRDWIVVFIKTSGNIYKIKRFKITTANNISSINIIYDNASLTTTVMGNPINAVFRYRDDTFCKMYWVSTIGQIRSLNIFEDNSSLSEEMLKAFPPIELSEPTVSSIESGGILYTGKYQYSYQLFNIDGAETVFSPPSFPISIGSGNLYGQSNEFFGGNSNEVSNKSCIISISNIDNRYENIRIVSIYYKDDVNIPDIRVIAESKLGSSTFTCLDTGAVTLDTYTPEEFNFIGGRVFSSKSIEVKDNFLVASNIEEEYFDIDIDQGTYWDARAYRHYSNSPIFKIDGSNSADLSSVAEDANCILSKQDQGFTSKFKRNSTILGGSGTNISYEFFLTSIEIDSPVTADPNTINSFKAPSTQTQNWNSSIDSGFSNNSYYKNYASPINAAQLAGYQRDEIYRFGIVFIKDGRHSFVKWIGDIKFPSIHEVNGNTTYNNGTSNLNTFDTFYRDTNTGIMYANVLGIKFTVNNVPSGYKWQIVRVPRTENDKTILTQGVASYNRTTNEGGNGEKLTRVFSDTSDYISNSATEKYVIVFNSPEINYNKINIGKSQGDRLVFQKGYTTNNLTVTKLIDESSPDSTGNRCYIIYTKCVDKDDYILGYPATSEKFVNVKDTIKVSPRQSAYIDSFGQTFLSNSFINVINDDHDYSANGGTAQYISLDNPFSLLSGTINDSGVSVFNYERLKDSVIYGGNTYAARSINNYIKCGSLESGNADSYVLLGDTFLNYFELLALMYAPGKFNKVFSNSYTLYVPVESTINLDMVNGFLRSKSYMARELFSLQETNELGKSLMPLKSNESVLSLEQDVSTYLNAYKDVYIYNNAFSREIDAKKYFPKPLNFKSLNKFKTKIINSELYNGASLSDPWLKFMYISEITLDGQYGDITKILDFNNKLLAFQERAVAVVGFNDREVLQSNSSTTLTLGVGDRLNYYQYLSKKSGTSYHDSIIDTGNGLYYLDNINKKLMTFQDSGVVSLSDLGECTDLFDKLLFTNNHVTSGYDYNKRKLYFTIKDELTISFNEKLGAFESKHSYYPEMYFNYNNFLLSIPSEKTSIWKHFSGDALNYYGTVSNGSVTFIFNGGKESFKHKKVFNNLEFQARFKKADNSIETISSLASLPITEISLSTGYQNKTITPVTQLTNKFYTWRYALPRDNSGRRFMDYYLLFTIKNGASNVATNLLTIDDIAIHYLIPII